MTFAPGCRNNWHIHHKGGQILLITGGKGWYQTWGGEAQELHPGDIVNIPPEVKHWHGVSAAQIATAYAVSKGVYEAGTIKGTPAMQEAYEMGKQV